MVNGKSQDYLPLWKAKVELGASFRSGSFPIFASHGISSRSCCSSNILASSPNSNNERNFLSDRRVWYHQFKLKVLMINSIRITAIQFGQVLSNYYVDMMDEAMKLDAKVVDDDDPITREQADLMENVWSQIEWEKRFDVGSILSKCKILIINSHLISLVMRGLEAVMVTSCTPDIADSYMIDTYSEAARKFDRDYTSDSDEGKGKTKADIAKEMAVVCLRANAIAYLADYIVFQCRLAYLTFFKSNTSYSDEKLNIFYKSSQKLMLSRSIGLLASSAGALVGTLVLPPGGYGTLLGGNIGDGLVGALMDNN